MWQAFIQLVSIVIKELSTSEDENFAERLLLKLVKSNRYHYSSKKPVAEIAWLIRIIITKTRGFAEGNIPHIVLANLKREKK